MHQRILDVYDVIEHGAKLSGVTLEAPSRVDREAAVEQWVWIRWGAQLFLVQVGVTSEDWITYPGDYLRLDPYDPSGYGLHGYVGVDSGDVPDREQFRSFFVLDDEGVLELLPWPDDVSDPMYACGLPQDELIPTDTARHQIRFGQVIPLFGPTSSQDDVPGDSTDDRGIHSSGPRV